MGVSRNQEPESNHQIVRISLSGQPQKGPSINGNSHDIGECWQMSWSCVDSNLHHFIRGYITQRSIINTLAYKLNTCLD